MKAYITSVCLALAVLFVAGCPSHTNTTPAQEVQVWDNILKHDIAIVRAAVAAQPAGPKRDKLLAQIDAVQNWESLGAAVSAAVAEGVTVPNVPTTQPVK